MILFRGLSRVSKAFGWSIKYYKKLGLHSGDDLFLFSRQVNFTFLQTS